MKFKIVAYDKQTHGSFPAASVNNDYRVIAPIEDEMTWREIELIQRGVVAALHSMDVEGITIALMVINDTDAVSFPLRGIIPSKGEYSIAHPMIIAEQYHAKVSTTDVRLNNEDIDALMKLLPLGNGWHSSLREKLHQASLTLHQKK